MDTCRSVDCALEVSYIIHKTRDIVSFGMVCLNNIGNVSNTLYIHA